MRGTTYRRFSREFKLGVVEAYLAGEGSLKGLATKAGVDHRLVHYWLKKYHAGELSLDVLREEQLVETEQQIAALERKVGQLTMELDLLKRGLIAAPATSSGRSLIISGPAGSAPGEDVG
jgi:transposase